MSHSWGIRWAPFVDGQGRAYPLHHLHPFHYPVTLPETDEKPAQTVMLYVSFSLHTFTRDPLANDDDADKYSDEREVRTFDMDRYNYSPKLPNIFRTLDQRRMEFSTSMKYGANNYVTIELDGGVRYAAFFNLRRFSKLGPDAIHLPVLSAYPLTPGKPHQGKGRIGLNALIGHTIRGTKPHPPPKR